MSMRIGTFCYAISRGLGHLAKAFYDHGIITDPLVVKHSSIPTNEHWYSNAPTVNVRNPDARTLRQFVRDKDAMLFFETPFDWGIIPYCKSSNVRTYLVTMYECTPVTHYSPHKFICPSLLDMQYFPDGEFLTLPVDVPWKPRTEARYFVHNGGYLGIRGREGTELLIEAMRFVKSPIRLTIRVQENVSLYHQRMMAGDSRVEYIARTVPFSELYSSGDVYIAPQKWNGCSLPLQEAYASGMMVMTTDRFPMNTWLPREPLIPVAGTKKNSCISGAYLRFDESILDPVMIAATIDNWYGQDISSFSQRGRDWAGQNSWEVLKPKWMEVLSR